MNSQVYQEPSSSFWSSLLNAMFKSQETCKLANGYLVFPSVLMVYLELPVPGNLLLLDCHTDMCGETRFGHKTNKIWQ